MPDIESILNKHKIIKLNHAGLNKICYIAPPLIEAVLGHGNTPYKQRS